MADMQTEVISIIEKVLAQKKDESRGYSPIRPTDKLEEIGLDSIDGIEMIYEIESKFDIHFPFNANDTDRRFLTVADVVTAVERLVSKSA